MNVHLVLYVAGSTARSKSAMEGLRAIVAMLGDRCTSEVIDVLDRPAQARIANVAAIPTLVRRSPLPERRFLGDLLDLEEVLSDLELKPQLG